MYRGCNEWECGGEVRRMIRVYIVGMWGSGRGSVYTEWECVGVRQMMLGVQSGMWG